MTDVALHDYVHEIASMIEGSSYDTAIAHCKHVLNRFPKYVEVYRLIGKAALEKEDDATALDIFQRVLAVDPEDFVARVGMSIIFDRRNELDKAVWHMERAFDLMPSNGVIQGELKRLYARRDGTEPDRISLTRGALARMYAQGDLYPEAIADIKRMLHEQPDRIDLQVLLTQVLWRDDQRIEAAEWAQKVLKQLPYCLTPNLILGEVWKSDDQSTESEVPLKRAQQIDPENLFAAKFFGSVSPLPEQVVMIDRLDLPYVPTPSAMVAEPEEVPDWLKGLSDVATPSQLQQPESAKAPKLPTGLHMPDTGPLKAEVPEWLQGLVPATEVPSTAATLPATPANAEATPDWLSQLRSAPEVTESSATAPDATGEVPDWISQISGTEPLTEAPAATAAPISGEEIPDWITRLGTGSLEQSSVLPEAAADTSDWIARPSTDAAEPASVLPEPAADMPDWLANLKPPELEVEPSPAAAEPDWLSSLKEADGKEAQLPAQVQPPTLSAIPGAEVSAPEPPITAAEVPEGVPSQDDALAFLARLSAGKEDQLRAQAELEATARMDVIMGRNKTSPLRVTGTGPLPQPESVKQPPAVPTAPKTEAASPQPEPAQPSVASIAIPEGVPSQDDALAFLARLSAGKEDQLRAQAELEATARMDVIMGRKKTSPLRVTGTGPLPQPESVKQPPAVPSPALSNQEALAFLQNVAADKESKMSQTMPTPSAAPIESETESGSQPIEPVALGVPASEQVTMVQPQASIGSASPATMLPAWWWTQAAEDEGEEPLAELPEPYQSPRSAASAAPMAKRSTGSLRDAVAPPKPGTAPLVLPSIRPAVNVEPLLARLTANADDHDARLELARAYWSTGVRDEALEHYSRLVSAGAHTNEAYNDLERITEIDDRSDWHRLFGDVCMKSGQLTRALDAYHRALSRL